MPIEKDDYKEPRCPLCTAEEEESPKPIPLSRIIEKVDSFYAENDYEGAERVLKYWLNEAEIGHDKRGMTIMYSELMGNYRKTLQADKSIFCATQALTLTQCDAVKGTSAEATVTINAATVFQAFGDPEKAIGLFEKAGNVYDAIGASADLRGALANNMATTLVSLKRFDEARENFNKAISYMKQVENGLPDCAISCLNLANLAEAEFGLIDGADEIDRLLDEAEKYLDDKSVRRDYYYAFVASKCAPTFEYYGRFLYAAELEKRSRNFYEGT